MRLIALCLLCAMLLSGCDTDHRWTESVRLGDGQIVQVERELVVGPDEFLMPDRGMIKRSSTVFPTSHGPVRTPDTLPGGDGRRPYAAPYLVAYVHGDPVIAYRVVAEACAPFGHPPEGIVVYRHVAGAWQRVPVSLLPADTPLNLDPTARGQPTYSGPPDRLDAWIASNRKDLRGCVATAESARQADRYPELRKAYLDTSSTLAWPAASASVALPAQAELDLLAALDAPIEGPDPRKNGEEFMRRQVIRERIERSKFQERQQQRLDAGCDGVSLASGSDVLKPAVVRFGPGPRDIFDIPQCDARCGSMQKGLRILISARALACTPETLGVALIVDRFAVAPQRLVVARFARADGALLRVDTLTLPARPGLPWRIPETFRLGDDAQIDVMHQVKIGDRVYPDARHTIRLPPLDAR